MKMYKKLNEKENKIDGLLKSKDKRGTDIPFLTSSYTTKS